jgi:hypothetical protein
MTGAGRPRSPVGRADREPLLAPGGRAARRGRSLPPALQRLPHRGRLRGKGLWDAHAHLIDAFDGTARIAFLSPEPGSGKSRALEIIETLTPRSVTTVNASAYALFRLVEQGEGLPTLLFDEIDTIFGPKAGDNELLRGFLNSGYRRGGKSLRCPPPSTTSATATRRRIGSPMPSPCAATTSAPAAPCSRTGD